MRRRRYAAILRTAALAAAVLLVLTSAGPVAALSRMRATPDTTVTVDARDTGRVFDGVGAISASSSRLLYDYPEPERSQILDYLFRPKYGAGLQILKVEIGGDANSTVIAEPSHARTRTDLDCGRGIEWWLMREAKKRNPGIKLAGLMWSAPGWLDGGRWSADHVSYLMSWLGCAKRNGLRIDALGGSNEEYEKPPEGAFFAALKTALAARYPEVKVLATDEHAPPDYWYQATRMRADPAYANGVDILGEHDVCVWRSLYEHCHVNDDALALGKPLWNSEQSTQDVVAGAGPLARAMNRNYLDAKITGNVNWAALAAFADDTEVGGTGLLAAQWPWSGHYLVGPSVWVDAQTTQFTRPGWHYVDGAGGYLPGGGSHVALRDPRTGDYTVVFETVDATAPQTVRIAPAGGLSGKPLSVWSTDLRSTDPHDWFVRRGTVRPGDTLQVPPGQVLTVSTTTGQHRGTAAPRSRTPGSAPLPYRPDFGAVPAGRAAPWFADVSGAFEAGACPPGGPAHCYRQVITQKPYLWHAGGALPLTLTGDPNWWGDYRVSVRARSDAAVELLGRVDKYNATTASGDHFRLDPSGAWRLYSESGAGTETTLASGTLAGDPSGWHRLGLWFRGDRVVASVDGRTVADVTDARHRTGQVGMGVGDWTAADFADLDVRPTVRAPSLATPVAATATSAQPGVFNHHLFTADQVFDGRTASWWQSAFDTATGAPTAPLPQAITVDLGRARTTYGLVYGPPVHQMAANAIITGYRVAASTDGRTYTPVAAGSWDGDVGTKTAGWPATRARYLRLEATGSSGGTAAAAELAAAVTPIP
ncbi:MAG TPA: discoidin domain-containing protein [Streptosporangiaceae bacterium]|jgi:O-glycosyl hydrolase